MYINDTTEKMHYVVPLQAALQYPMNRLDSLLNSSQKYNWFNVIESKYIYQLYTGRSSQKYNELVVLESQHIYQFVYKYQMS